MKHRLTGAVLSVAVLLSACGGGGSSPPPPPTGPIGGTPPPPPSSASSACSLRARQDSVAAQIREWYLFPELLPASLDPTPFGTVQAYIDALVATARAQRKDRFFTYITSIAEENAFFNSGSTAGFGFRLASDPAAKRVLVTESYEGAPALAAGIDRGTEILAIGTSGSNLRTVADILTAEGAGGVTNALGPNTPGTSRVLRIKDASGTRDVTVAKADFTLTPVSSRYGARIIDDGGKRVGYVNLRTFISTADPALRQAFADFRAQGVTEVIVDFRYNGGGLVSTANLLGDLLGGNRSTSDIYSLTTFRAEKASNNSRRNFAPQPQSISPTRLAFIATPSSASASELVINAFIPYYRNNMALVGGNTFGKPVGQIALDRAECDDRLRVIAFRTENAAGQGDYFDGLATKVDVTCRAADDIGRQLGDPQEASTRQALDYLAGRTCTPISTGLSTQSVRDGERRELLVPEQPSTAQREAPGTF
jgi:C-terminal processing protease CtpA/Prc